MCSLACLYAFSIVNNMFLSFNKTNLKIENILTNESVKTDGHAKYFYVCSLCPRYPDTHYPDSSLTGQMAFLVIRTKQWSRYPDKMLVCPDNEDLTARFNLEICGKFRKIVNLKYLYYSV